MLTDLFLASCTYDKIALLLPLDDDRDHNCDECDDAGDTDVGLGLLDCLVLAGVFAGVVCMRTFRTGVLAPFDGVVTGTGGGIGRTGATKGGTSTLATGTICFMSCDIILNISPRSVLSSLQDRHHMHHSYI